MLNSPDALYQLLPAYIRQRDAQSGGALQQLMAIIGKQAQLIDRDLLRMYDNNFIETCEPWVVPYIAELLGYQPSSGADASPALAQYLAPRREVANSIAFERRKGTLMVLEELARDVAHWPAVAVEFYRRLVQAQHLDHLHPDRPATADLHNAAQLQHTGSPFDTLCRTADVRRIGNAQSAGWYNPASVGLFVFRQRRYSVTRTYASCQREAGQHCYAFSILGNDVALYRKPEPPARLPLPILRGELEAEPAPDASSASADPALYGPGLSLWITVPDWPRKGDQGQVPASAVIPADLSSWSYRVPKNHVAVDPQLGRIMFPLKQRPQKGVLVNYGYGFAMDLGGGEYSRPALPLPARVTRVRVRAAEHGAPEPGTFRTIGMAIDDWQTARAGPPETRPEAALVVELADSGSYHGAVHITLGQGESVWIVAAPGTRPVLLLTDERDGAADRISVQGATGSRLTLDGLLVAGHGIDISPRLPDDGGGIDVTLRSPEDREAIAIAPGLAADGDGGTNTGDLCQVWIRHSTLVPGWGLSCDCRPTHPGQPSVVLDGSAACLRIDHSITGPVQVAGADEAAPIVVTDSIIDAMDISQPAIAGTQGDIALALLTIARSTIVGEVAVHAITRAEDSLFLGKVEVARRQTGCVRYCYLPAASRTPRRHRCQPDDAIAAARAKVDADTTLTPAQRAARKALVSADTALRVRPHFESLRYGSELYARLHPSTAAEIAAGAQDGSEMGVYHDLFEPQRLALLNARLAEYVPATFEAATLHAHYPSASSQEAKP
ncbi:hypothetical protein D0T25_27160 [Duganella sp. BJB488]|uniref:hypothetical protein n=1 Tax=unclassified Duganella TaxID=2636909 RepID=UPI000E357AE0|nr:MULTISPECIES: hypothetical protein [unclassified Duganella]RFP10994.1 hypothetical protein D0T26_26135 [Duganella sp. BJB489]RFP14457.1 hypothetical protein D0T25_27160 [Duganella sp. BJB488]RFP30393.1 hypothetical protein D0T24_27860 [Duganella sp. BJB480]